MTIPTKLCECGCGQAAPIARANDGKRGHVKGQPLRFIHGHNARIPIRERVFSRLAADPSGCLLWTGPLNTSGYGILRADGRTHLVHRLVWELTKGPIPDGLRLDHVRDRGCRNRHCANVAHLEPVTNQVNVLRGDTIPAAYAARDRCNNGHLFDEANTYWRKGGGRACRACRRKDGTGSIQ